MSIRVVVDLYSTYGPWFISLLLETVLYGIGLLQTWLYFQWWNDGWEIRGAVLLVFFFETVQVIFFWASSFERYVMRFGRVQPDLMWTDSVQLLANYLSAFTVQLYFASRIWHLTRDGVRFHSVSRWGIYFIIFLAFTQNGSAAAGTVQTAWTYIIRHFAELDRTKATTTLQTAASLVCDMSITVYLCIFLRRHQSGMPRTRRLLKAVMINAVNRGMLTSLTSAGTMILFVVFPNTFWFFLTLAPNSKLYMNSMLATLNMRDHFRKKLFGPAGHEPDTVNLHEFPFSPGSRRISVTVSAVEFVHPPPGCAITSTATGPTLSVPNKTQTMSCHSSCSTSDSGMEVAV
ncbi:hypothetical protein MIND_01143600 [Mycena indigotica]|uniref:DUF6534 domain-containing protein n=1 Tax=Mycena indigotica TaxID=2126181 RepID=A0A8H6VVP8_9AGAR|nr:uncharacterized protein MIND_01143600 [Mycena indigotica]KAF7293641.1 hypothetical protein MIND_01143600 [Mycena indigotica]